MSSYGDIGFTTPNTSYIHQLPTQDIAKILNFLSSYLLPLAISRGAFAPKNSAHANGGPRTLDPPFGPPST